MKKLQLLTAATLFLIGTQAQAEETLDSYKEIRTVWQTCAGCHGQKGEGMASFPALAGRDADYIINALLQYKRQEPRGPMSALMYGQAQTLTDGQIGTIGVYIQQGFPNE